MSYNGIVSFIVKVLAAYDIKATQSLNHLETEHLDGYHDLLAMVAADGPRPGAGLRIATGPRRESHRAKKLISPNPGNPVDASEHRPPEVQACKIPQALSGLVTVMRSGPVRTARSAGLAG